MYIMPHAVAANIIIMRSTDTEISASIIMMLFVPLRAGAQSAAYGENHSPRNLNA